MRCWMTWRAVCAATRPKVLGCGFDDDHVAQLRFRVDLAGFLEQDLGLGFEDILDHFLFGKDHHLARVGIDPGFHVLRGRRADSPPIG
jgi:hypothetical protein